MFLVPVFLIGFAFVSSSARKQNGVCDKLGGNGESVNLLPEVPPTTVSRSQPPDDAQGPLLKDEDPVKVMKAGDSQKHDPVHEPGLKYSMVFHPENLLRSKTRWTLQGKDDRVGEADLRQGSGGGQNGNDRKSEEHSGKNSLVARFLKQKNGGDNKVDSAAQEQEKATIDTNLKNYKTNGIADAHFKGSSNSFPSQPQPLSSHPANTNWLKSSSFERSNYGSQQDAQFKRSSNSFPSQPQPLSSHPANTNWLKSPSFGKSNYGSQQGMSSIGYQPSASSNTYSAISPSYFGGSSNSIRSDQQNKEEFTEGCNVGGRKLRVGDKWTVTGICGKFTCQGNNFRTLTTECPTLRFQEGSNCYVDDQDMSLEFPQCCPILICPNAASQTMQIATPPNAIATPPNASNKNDYKFF